MPYYVTMIDKFMSGWGMAEGKKNVLMIECQTIGEARIVASNARDRTEMIFVKIRGKKPYYNPNKYLVSIHNEGEYRTWFKPNAFKNQK